MSDDEMPEPRDGLEWAKKLVDDRAWVIHVGTMTVGRVERLYDGEGSVYVSPSNQKAVRAPVLEFEGGASHVADPSAFTVLTDAERSFVVDAACLLDPVLVECAKLSDAMGMARPKGMLLLATVLRMSAAKVDRARGAIVAAMRVTSSSG